MSVEIKGNLKLKSTPEILRERGIGNSGRVQKVIDSEVLRLCEPYVPLLDGTLIKSGIINTKIGSGTVIYSTPYARRHYYRPARFRGAPKRGNYWFERMKNEGGRDKILKVAIAVAILGAKK